MKMRYMVLISSLLLMLIQPARADFRDLFQRQFVDKPWAGAPIINEGVCIQCHTSKLMKQDMLKIPQEWRMSIHGRFNVSCHNCHGGDPSDVAKGCESPHGGRFIGTPKPKVVPRMCGRCHVGILKSYISSGHGKALMKRGIGPNCVTCHGSHRIQKANIDIINSVRCSQCHTYDRARSMKQALFTVENRFKEIEDGIKQVKKEGAITEDIEKELFRTMADYRALFHTVDVQLVRKKTGEFGDRLDKIQKDLSKIAGELRFRKTFSGGLFLLSVLMLITYHFATKTKTERTTDRKEG